METMNLQARVDKYRERDFQQSDAEILVLMEESAAAIFAAFPNHFVLFGGATLVLFYGSPRVSRDLDLLPSPGPLPKAEHIHAVIRSRIQALAGIFGLGQLEFRQETARPDFVKHWVLANQKTLFSIDLTRIGGHVLETQIVKKTIGDTPETTVLTPNVNYLLFQKSFARWNCVRYCRYRCSNILRRKDSNDFANRCAQYFQTGSLEDADELDNHSDPRGAPKLYSTIR